MHMISTCWYILIGFYIVSVSLPSVACRVGYSSKETVNAAKVTCNGTNGEEYVCSYGHCCEDGCCSYYYELWWFWLIWSLVILLSCCCFYHQRQKHIAQRSRARRPRRHKDRYEGVCNYPGPPLEKKLLGSCKLPGYKDVIRMPPTSSPPPPYSARRRSIHTIACLQANERGETSMSLLPCNITSSMLSLASLSYYIPSILANNSIQFKPIRNPSEHQVVDSNNNQQTCVDIEKAMHEPMTREEGPSSPMLPTKPEFGRETPHSDDSRKWANSSESLSEINNNSKSNGTNSRDDYDDGLPQYDVTNALSLRHNNEESVRLGAGDHGDVVLHLS